MRFFDSATSALFDDPDNDVSSNQTVCNRLRERRKVMARKAGIASTIYSSRRQLQLLAMSNSTMTSVQPVVKVWIEASGAIPSSYNLSNLCKNQAT